MTKGRCPMKWKKSSIKGRLFITFMITLALPVFASSFYMYTYSKKVVKELMIEAIEQTFRESRKNIASYFDRVNQASHNIYKSQFRGKSLTTVIKTHYDMESDWFFVDAISTIKDFEESIFQIYLYMENINRAFLFRDYMMANTIMNEGYAYDTDVEACVISLHPTRDYHIPHMINKHKHVISFVRNIYEVPKDTQIGQLVIDLDVAIFDVLLKDLYDATSESFYLINQSDAQIWYASDPTLIGQSLNASLLNASLTHIEKGVYNFPWSEDTFEGICVIETIEKPYMNLMMIKQIPVNKIDGKINEMLHFIIILLVLIIIVSIVSSLRNSFYFTKPIQRLLEAIKQVNNGHLDTVAVMERKDEFGELEEHFNHMMHSINEHIELEYKLKIENTTTELKALQSQINSHFMNNVLQSIGTEAIKSHNRKVYDLIVQLGNMMNYSMRNQDQIVQISDELDYCQNYLSLQAHRFNQGIGYHIEVDDDMIDVNVPKMILQPIVENCFVHGFREAKNLGRIIITVIKMESNCILDVADNGRGLDEDMIKQLNQGFKAVIGHKQHHKSIGLLNIAKRLHYHYGDKSMLSVSHNKYGGLTVRITIPLGR